MDNAVTSQAEGDEEMLTFDIPDEELERAASAERQAVTWAYCTNGYYWYDCNWPQSRSIASPPAAWRYSPRSFAPQARDVWVSQALIIERAVISASSRVPKTVLSFGILLPGR